MQCYTVLIFFCIIDTSVGIIYKLNSTEYEKLPPLFELDDYDDCFDNSGPYCVVALELNANQDNKIYKLIHEYSEHFMKHFNYTKLDRGVCVKKRCAEYINIELNYTDKDIEVILERCMKETIKQNYNIDIKINTVTCERHKNEWAPIDTLDYAVGAVIAIICITTALGSYYDLHRNIKNDGDLSKPEKFLLCFSIFRNMKRLTQFDEHRYQVNDWKGVDGIRIIIQVFALVGHANGYYANFIANPHDFEKSYYNPLALLVYSSSSVIKLFFFISAFLMIYGLQTFEEKKLLSWQDLLRAIAYRWWRFTPTLAILIAFMATWFRHMGSGPLWKYYVTQEMTTQCRTYFWAHIFFFNNYVHDDYVCALETWQIAADFQLFILALVVHFVIRKRSWTFKVATLLLLFLISIICPALEIGFKDLDAFSTLKPELYRTFKDKTFNNYQQFAWNNLICFTMGMANGYLAYYLKQKGLVYKSKICNFFSWLTIPVLALIFYMGSSFLEDVERPSVKSRILFACWHQVALGFIATYNVLGIVLKFNGFFTHVLEWRGWRIPSRLSYCIYLIHLDVTYYLACKRTHLITFSLTNWFYVSCSALLLSTLLALVLNLLVESPTNQLIKLILNGNKNKEKKE